jgi:hypothetical protein
MSNNSKNTNTNQDFLLEGMDTGTQDNFLADIDWVKVGVGVATATVAGYAIYKIREIDSKLDSVKPE